MKDGLTVLLTGQGGGKDSIGLAFDADVPEPIATKFNPDTNSLGATYFTGQHIEVDAKGTELLRLFVKMSVGATSFHFDISYLERGNVNHQVVGIHGTADQTPIRITADCMTALPESSSQRSYLSRVQYAAVRGMQPAPGGSGYIWGRLDSNEVPQGCD